MWDDVVGPKKINTDTIPLFPAIFFFQKDWSPHVLLSNSVTDT